MNRLALLLPLWALNGCFDLDAGTIADPPDPEIREVSAACDAGVLSLYALVESEIEVTNLVVEVTGVDGEPGAPLFPVKALENAGSLTRWDLDLEHDCDDSIALQWTAWSVLETSATYDSAWPDVNLDGGLLQPAHGSDAGGSLVTVSGEGMDEIDRVWFGDGEATIASATDSQLIVSTPPGEAYTTVDVRLQAGVTEETLTEAYTYWPDASGLTSGLVRMVVDAYNPTWFTIGSAYTTLSPYGPFVQHEAVLHLPMDPVDSFASYFPPAGSCEFGGVSWERINAGGYLTLESPETGALPFVSTGGDTPNYWYVEADVVPTDWSGLVFDLTLPEETEIGPAGTLEDAVTTVTHPGSPSFDWQTAGELVRGEPLDFSWSGGDASRVLWTAYPARGTSALDSVTCADDATTGSLSIPWSDAIAGADESRITSFIVFLSFIREGEAIFDHDNSALLTFSQANYWLYYDVVDE